MGHPVRPIEVTARLYIGSARLRSLFRREIDRYSQTESMRLSPKSSFFNDAMKSTFRWNGNEEQRTWNYCKKWHSEKRLESRFRASILESKHERPLIMPPIHTLISIAYFFRTKQPVSQERERDLCWCKRRGNLGKRYFRTSREYAVHSRAAFVTLSADSVCVYIY